MDASAALHRPVPDRHDTRRRNLSGWMWAAIPLMIGLAATLAAWQSSRLSTQASVRTQFDFAANNVISEITDRLDAHVHALWGAAGLFATHETVTRADWQAYTGSLQLGRRLPGAAALSFIKRVPASEREAHVQEMRAQGAQDYLIWPDSDRAEHNVVTFVSLVNGGVPASLGFDVSSQPDRAAALERARDTGEPAVSAKLTLVSDMQRAAQPGFVLYLPVYRHGASVETVEDRRGALIGYVFSPFRAQSFILTRGLAQFLQQAGLAIEVYDGIAPHEDDLLYRSPEFPASGGSDALAATVAESVGGRTWTFRVAALPSFVPNVTQRVPLFILGAGLIITFLASAVVGALALNRAQAVEANERLRADVTRREHVEERLRESEARFRELFDNIPLPIFAIDRQTLRYVAVNEAAVHKYGYSHAEFARMLITEIRPPEEIPVVLDYMHKVRDQDRYEGEFRHRLKDGRVIDVEVTGHNIALDGRDATVVVAHDITERKQARAALAASEQQLRQSQKLEAIGQLTGGIAHDFNNILTVITGTIEILADGVAQDASLSAIAKLIDEAASRGADLTRGLLAFARRQPLQPRETDINVLVLGAARLFRSTLGERIETDTKLDLDLTPAFVDSTQLATALLNLALNARDAMPNGGKLTIETSNVVLDDSYAVVNADIRPGPYVMIAVSDTGSGIPDEIRDKVFEPFFTTKDIGKGTGLGLSMVYGFVKQSGGHVAIYSEEGCGTTIRLYLPQAASAALPTPAEANSAVAGGTETILAVEDDELVRNYVIAQLHSLGYTTHVAANAAEALAIVARGTPFDLLFTDIVMPGAMNGRALAEEVLRRHPQMRVLFTSGYTEEVALRDRLEQGVNLLSKPYRKADLARKIREVLDAPPPASV